MSIDTRTAGDVVGAPVHGRDGAGLGKVDTIFYDNDTGTPEWAAVKSGLFGKHVSLVPLAEGTWDGTTLNVPFDKEQLKAAPHHDPDSELSVSDEQDLYRHYGIDYAGSDRDADVPEQSSREQSSREQSRGGRGDRREGSDEAGGPGRDRSGPNTDEAMTRSEERLRVGTETHEAGRARLRKHIVTENVSTTVPVSHEEVTLEREPITDANRGDALSGPDLSEEEHEVSLHEERPVVAKETVPVERVRLGTETVTDEAAVEDTVRKEQIESDTSDTQRNRGTRRS